MSFLFTTPEILEAIPHAMSLQDAEDVLNSKGVRYGDMPGDQLAWVANNAKTPPNKKMAAQVILDARAAGIAQEPAK